MFHPETDFHDFHEAVNPSPEYGSSVTQLKSALRKFGVRSRNCHLNFNGIKREINAGHPVLVSICNRGDNGHWVVVYGYGRNPSRVFLASNILPFFNRNQYTLEEFNKRWWPKGNALVCFEA